MSKRKREGRKRRRKKACFFKQDDTKKDKSKDGNFKAFMRSLTGSCNGLEEG